MRSYETDSDEIDNIRSHDDEDDTSLLLPEDREVALRRSMEPAVLPQYVTTFSVCLGALSMGAILGYSSPAGPLLTDGKDSTIQLTDEENGYFSSILNVGAAVGALMAGYCISAFGRKPTMLFSIVPFLLGWGLIAGGQNYAMLMVGRVITGICCGLTSMTVPTYIGEIASPKVRGTLGSGFQLMVTIGVLYAYALAPFMDDFRWIAVVCGLPSVVYCIAVFFCKESPFYLVSKNREEETKVALRYLRGPHYDFSKEIDELKVSVEENARNKKTFKDLKTPHILKPFLICCAIMFFQQFSGINAVLFNLSLIFQSVGSSIPEEVSPIIIGAVQVVATFVASILIDRSGRKFLLTLSAIVMCISIVVLGVYFYELENNSSVADSIGWLPLVSLSVFIIAFSIGYGPVPWVLIGEMFSSDIRAVAGSISVMLNWTSSFIVTLLYEPLSTAMGEYGVYWLFGGICLVNFIFCIVFVVETKGKTFEEIGAIFGGPTAPSRRPRGDTDPSIEIST